MVQAGRQAGRQAGTMSTGSNIARAIEEIVTERDHLAARLAKIDELLATMRETFHLPSTERARPQRAKAERSTRAPTNGARVMLTDEMIVKALKDGPLSPGALTKRLGVDRAKLRFRVVGLEQRGFITSTGSTANRVLQLTAKAAKEAP